MNPRRYTPILPLLLLFFLSALAVQAQDTITAATIVAMGDTSGVVIYADERLDILLAKKETKNAQGYIGAMRGYRVQIYSGTDRNKANQAKVNFMRRFPDIRVYMTYIMPQFRVKVGDFSAREDAAMLYRQLNPLYSPCMIVPDIVEVNTYKAKNKQQ
jgi:hypothetical protein